MIAWWWIPIILIVGACMGAVVMGVCAANNAYYRNKKERWDDNA